MRSLLVFAAGALFSAVSFAQESSTKPSFEVVSIRHVPDGEVFPTQGGPGSSDPERFTAKNIRAKVLLLRAYGVKNYQVSGPGWFDAARYDIAAKIPPGATEEQFDLMLQQMLEERFGLKLHHTTKEFPAFNSVVAKRGVKLKESMSTDACAMGARPAGGTCPAGASYPSGIALSKSHQAMALSFSKGSAQLMTGRDVQLPTLVNGLEGQLAGPIVINKTSLTDQYDFRFEFVSPTASADDDSPPPSLFAALEKDLGLKLEPSKAYIEVLAIDHIEQPSEN